MPTRTSLLRKVVGSAAAAVACVAGMPGVGSAGEPLAITVPACLRVSTEVRYRPFGYDHVVHLQSSCDEAARCSVSTDVSPPPTEVIVRAHESAEVVTFQASPARTFAVSVECQLLGAS